jgi:hypothetical protein
MPNVTEILLDFWKQTLQTDSTQSALCKDHETSAVKKRFLIRSLKRLQKLQGTVEFLFRRLKSLILSSGSGRSVNICANINKEEETAVIEVSSFLVTQQRTEDRNRPSFRNFVFSSIQNTG